MLWSAMLAFLGTGLLSLTRGWAFHTDMLFVLAVVCAVGLVLVARGADDRVTAVLLCTAIFAGITLAAYRGDGLYDESIVAYPAFILCAAFLFAPRRAIVFAVTLSVAAVAVLGYLEMHGMLVTKFASTPLRVLVLSILLVATGGVIWVVREGWQRNLDLVVESYDQTLQGWASALEFRDRETAGHCDRVQELSIELARRIGCDAGEVEAIRRGAYMHDIGKMGVPDSILLKPGPLTEEEREVMERHPQIGHDLIANIPFFAEAAAVIYSHHECWDGTGYPEGLTGEEIPLAARVFTVADQWDALNSDRPYRLAWPREKALAYMQDEAGRIYDPAVVEVLFEILGEDVGRD